MNLLSFIKKLFSSLFQTKSAEIPKKEEPIIVEPKTVTEIEEEEEEEEEIPEVVVVIDPNPVPAAPVRKYQIIREPDQRFQTLGTLVVTEGDAVIFSCKTIELPWKNNQTNISCIPEGTYVTERHNSPKYNQCFWLKNVPGRSEILIHHGNYAASINPNTGTPDTRGCILPGDRHADVNQDGIPDVTNSLRTMNRLREILPDRFDLEILTRTV